MGGRRPDSIRGLVGATGRLVVVMVAAIGWLAGPDAAANPPNRPNVLFIVTDDQRTGTIGFADPASSSPCAPPAQADGCWMPATARLFFNEGTKFEDALAVTSLCCPSRASIFTGRYPHNHGVATNSPCNVMPPSSPRPSGCPDDGSYGRDYASFHNSTVQHYLKATGYTTGLVGKYLNKWPLLAPPPDFDRWAYWQNGHHYSTGWPNPCPNPAAANDNTGVNCVNDNYIIRSAPAGQYETDYAADRVRDFVTYADCLPTGPEYDCTPGADERPWFLYVAPTVPHSPFDAEVDYASRVVPALGQATQPNVFKPDPLTRMDDPPFNKPPWITDTNPATNPFTTTSAEIHGVNGTRNQQLRMLKSVDDMVASIFDTLSQNGEDGETLAIFVSDNGYMWGEHWLKEKAVAYSNASRVPLMMRWPANPQVLRGMTDTRLAANIDLLPSVMGALAIQPDPGTPLDGRSLIDQGSSPRNRLLIERMRKNVTTSPPLWASLRSPSSGATTFCPAPYQSCQYIESYDGLSATPSSQPSFRELYNHQNDSWQRFNVFASLPQLSKDGLFNRLHQDLGCKGQPPRPDACP